MIYVGKQLWLLVVTKFASQGVNIVACVRTASNEFSAYLNTLCENYDINIEIVFVDLANPESITSAMREIFQKKILYIAMIFLNRMEHLLMVGLI